MRFFRTASVLAILSLLVAMSFVAFLPNIALNSNGVTTTSITTTSKIPPSFILQGHSPVDLLLIGPGGQEIGCTAEPCMFGLPGLFDVVNNFSSGDGAIFSGTTGLGQEQELSQPETILILHPPAGTYTVEIFPSCTYYDPYSITDLSQFIMACSPGSTTSIKATASFTITMCALLNGQCPPSGQIEFKGSTSGYCSPNCGTVGNIQLSLNSKGITIISSVVTPEFPLGTVLAVLTPLAAISIFVLTRKRNSMGSTVTI
jgi:hypothetical protein